MSKEAGGTVLKVFLVLGVLASIGLSIAAAFGWIGKDEEETVAGGGGPDATNNDILAALQSVENKSDSALDTALQAKDQSTQNQIQLFTLDSNAQNAQATADSAQSDATAALDSASQAGTAAATAQTDANSALSAATNAQSTADTALTEVNTTKPYFEGFVDNFGNLTTANQSVINWPNSRTNSLAYADGFVTLEAGKTYLIIQNINVGDWPNSFGGATEVRTKAGEVITGTTNLYYPNNITVAVQGNGVVTSTFTASGSGDQLKIGMFNRMEFNVTVRYGSSFFVQEM